MAIDRTRGRRVAGWPERLSPFVRDLVVPSEHAAFADDGDGDLRVTRVKRVEGSWVVPGENTAAAT